MNSFWLILGSLAAFTVAYRVYGAFLAAKVALLNDSRPTPAHRLKDGVDYHPTNRLVFARTLKRTRSAVLSIRSMVEWIA